MTKRKTLKMRMKIMLKMKYLKKKGPQDGHIHMQLQSHHDMLKLSAERRPKMPHPPTTETRIASQPTRIVTTFQHILEVYQPEERDQLD
jgi:type II secretory ATPase GspE/PulE/Tfp pilus assembly ATPase PilB-like protein